MTSTPEPPVETLVATANVLRDLDTTGAEQALRLVLGSPPDLVGLQEWGRGRRRSLTRVGAGHTWCRSPYGELAAGARTDRYDLLGSRVRPLGYLCRCELGARGVPVVPPRVALVTRWHDRRLDAEVSLVVYHLVPGTQARGRYRDDRPLLAARHRAEVARLQRIVTGELTRTGTVYATGDSNFDGLRLAGLTSAWQGREAERRGTLTSHRKIDDVFGPGPALSVDLVETPSDHRAVLARR